MRGKKAPVRDIKLDPVYKNLTVTKLINYVMQDGKKNIAQAQVYSAIEELNKITKGKGTESLEQAVDNVKPRVEVRSRRVGGSNYQVPVQVSEQRQLSLALRWIVDSARSRRNSTPFWKVLAGELADAFKREGGAMRKKEDVKKMAEANKAFAQFA